MPAPTLVAVLVTAATASDGPRVRATVFNELTALPFTKVVATPLHPGLRVGVGVWERTGTRFQHRLYVDALGYHHAFVENSLAVQPVWHTSWWPGERVGLSTEVGAGYKHALYPGTVYVQEDDGDWTAARDPGAPGASVSLALGLEVPVHDRWTVLAQYTGTADLPFHMVGALPFMPHVMLHLGAETRF